METEQQKKKNPFLTQKTSTTLLKSIFNIIIAFIKFPFLIIMLTLSFAYNIFSNFVPTNTLKRVVSSSTSSVLFRIILAFTGIYDVKEQPTPLIDTYTETEDITDPQPGDVIIANCASYLNLFWLQYKYSPIFAIPYDQTSVYVFNVYQILALILTEQKLKSKFKFKFTEVIKLASSKLKCPVVVFPEGSVTNGEYLINFMDFGKDLDLINVKFHIFGFLHSKSNISPNFTFGNGLLHFFSICGRFYSKMNVKIALPQDIKNSESNQIDRKWIERTRLIMSKITSLPLCDINGSEFEDFREKEKNQKRHND